MKSTELARMIVGQICLHACMAGTRMAAPLLALRDGHSALNVGVLLALFALAPVFLALPAGRFADRHGMHKPVGMSVAVAAIGAGLALVFPVFPVLCLSAFLTGGATGAASIALQRHVGRAAVGPTELRRVFSWLAIGPAVSNFIGPLAAGLMIDYAGPSAGDTTGYRAAFLLMMLLPITTWFWIRPVSDLPPITSVAGAAPTRAWDLMREPMMRRLMLVNWCMSSCWDVHMFAVPLLGHERGFNASVIGAILGAFAIAAALIRVAIPLVAAHLQEFVVVTSAMVVSALVFAVYPFMYGALAMGTCSVLLGLALGTVQPMVMSMLHQITPEARHGEALGLRLMAINASSVAMPLVFGTLGAVVGVSALFWAVGGFVVLGSRQAMRLRGDERHGHGASG
ncbi:MAG: MFS transporter [Rhodoferax sp.]|nr:MFS transporter [Rhodoferax sp.]MBP9928960.1 MFS transporter [Rhodoferax sp.]HQX60688.1 MFS transporter [Burkholderiaceae bacterium]